MDESASNLAQQLQLRLKQIDPISDRTTYEWLHGFLVALVKQIEKSIPTLALKQRSPSKLDRGEVERRAKELLAEFGRLDDAADSLEWIERELEGPEPDDPAAVPAKRKPGPKGLSGGVAVPLPHNDVDM